MVTRIAYGRGSVTYSTFDAAADDVLRLNFVPKSVMVGQRALQQTSELGQEGYWFDAATRVLRIHHRDARDVSINGEGGATPPRKVDFDDPHLAAGTILRGQYPSGVIDWGSKTWQIAVPHGRFSTFNLQSADAKADKAEFSFVSPRVFAGVTVLNQSCVDVTLVIHSVQNMDVTVTIPAGQLRRVHTGWSFRTSRVSFATINGTALGSVAFDDIAFTEDAILPPGILDSSQP